MRFPYHDRCWTDTADFVKSHLRDGESILSPWEFADEIPTIEEYDASFRAELASYSWVVLHKGMLENVSRRLLLSIENGHQPVFANEVFVVFNESSNLPAIARTSNHFESYKQRLAVHQEKNPAGRPCSKAYSFVRRHRLLRGIDVRRRLRRGSFFAPHRFHYFGEFGFLNFFVLGGLQRLFSEMPRVRLEVLTFPHYGELLEGLFPENIRYRSFAFDFKEALRSGHRTCDPDLTRRVEQLGYRCSLHKLFQSWAPDGLPLKGYDYLNLRTPLKHSLPAGAADRFVSIFPRNRTSMAFKNFTPADWLAIIGIVEEQTPYPIVIHGVGAESLDLPANPRFVFPRGPLEQIAYLNHSACFLSPDSGMVQFAMNCECDTLVLGGNQFFSAYLAYNPFHRRQETTPRDMKELLPRVERFVKQARS